MAQLQGDVRRVQEESVFAACLDEGAVLGEVAVGGVTDDGEAALATLHAELVGAAGVRRQFDEAEQRSAVKGLEKTHVGAGSVAVAGIVADPEAMGATLDLKVILPGFLAVAKVAEDEGEVGFLDGALVEAFSDESGEVGVGG